MVLEKTLESPLGSKDIKPDNSKGNQPWIFIGRTDAEALILWLPEGEEPTHWKRCWEKLMAGGEGDDRGWDGWMASLTQWTWVWASCRRHKDRETCYAAVAKLQRVGHNVVTKQQHFIYPSSIYWARQCISRSMYFADNDKIIDTFHWSMTRSMYFTDCKIQILTPHGKKKKLRLFIHSPNNVKHIFSAKYYYRQSLEGIQRWKLPSFI